MARKHDGSSGFFLTKTQTWGLATALAVLTLAGGTVAYFAIARAHSLDHMKEKVQELDRQVESLDDKQKALERQQVQMQTELESLHK